MSGHSKWSQIKRQKGVADAKRGQLFTKLGREITIAARQGGGDPEANFRLRLAVQKARDNNMPAENIERAIKRGAGGPEGAALEEVAYEGYGPGGTAILLQALTDNRNRTVSDLRNIFTRAGGNLGEAGSVIWLFEQRGVIVVDINKGVDAEELELRAIDAGADDVKVEDSSLEIYTKPEDLESVRKALVEQGLPIASAELSMVPKSVVQLEEKAALQTLKLLDRLEDLDDVQRVFSNADFPVEVVERYSAQA
jgi:YebC/PmpR family DNA-binding regulatory protein